MLKSLVSRSEHQLTRIKGEKGKKEERSDIGCTHSVTPLFRIYSSLFHRLSLSVLQSFCLFVFSLCLSLCLFVSLSLCLSVYQSICMSACLSVCLSMCLSVYFAILLSISLSVCPSVRFSSLYPLSFDSTLQNPRFFLASLFDQIFVFESLFCLSIL